MTTTSSNKGCGDGHEHRKGTPDNTTHKNWIKPVRASDKPKSRFGNRKEHSFDGDSSDESNHGNNFNDCNDNESNFDEIRVASKYQSNDKHDCNDVFKK